MTKTSYTTGRTHLRPVVYLAGGIIVFALVALAARVSALSERGPAFLPNQQGLPPTESMVGAVHFVSNETAGDSLVLDSVPPDRPSRLLFFQGRPVHPDYQGGGLAVDGAGGILRIDSELQVTRLMPNIDGRHISSVAAGPDAGLWLVTGDGEVARVDRDGNPLTDFTAGPFIYSIVASDSEGQAWLVRSPDQTGFRPVFGSTPLLAKLNDRGEVDETIGGGFVPRDFLLTHLASAGRIAVTDSTIYYAPFIRDQVIALSTMGDTLWVADRGLPQERPEPKFEVVDGAPMVDYAPVNLGIAVGPDEHVYVLSVPGFTTEQSRLDVFDAETGYLLRSTTIHNPLPTLAADADGRVYAIDEFGLLTGVPAEERQPFSEFDLETLAHGRMTSAHMMGRVTLINFWASWCAPCRVEMPALDSLRHSITSPEFQFLTMNEDVRVNEAREFMAEYGFEFPVLLGRGDLKAQYHYIGLPFTVLLDRSGKVVERWIGYAGEPQLAGIRAVVTAELDRGTTGDMGDAPTMFGEHGH